MFVPTGDGWLRQLVSSCLSGAATGGDLGTSQLRRPARSLHDTMRGSEESRARRLPPTRAGTPRLLCLRHPENASLLSGPPGDDEQLPEAAGGTVLRAVHAPRRPGRAVLLQVGVGVVAVGCAPHCSCAVHPPTRGSNPGRNFDLNLSGFRTILRRTSGAWGSIQHRLHNAEVIAGHARTRRNTVGEMAEWPIAQHC